MTHDDKPYTVALNIDGPRDPEYLLEVLQAAAQAIRVANHVSRDRAALGEPADAYHAILELASVAERLPQLFAQIGGWLQGMRVAVPSGTLAGRPGLAVLTVTEALEHAGTVASELRAVLTAAANVAAGLAAAEGGEGTDG